MNVSFTLSLGMASGLFAMRAHMLLYDLDVLFGASIWYIQGGPITFSSLYPCRNTRSRLLRLQCESSVAGDTVLKSVRSLAPDEDE